MDKCKLLMRCESLSEANAQLELLDELIEDEDDYISLLVENVSGDTE